MGEAEGDQFVDELLTTTTAYLDAIEDCVGLLASFLHHYDAGGDYHSVAADIAARESACDELNRKLGSLFVAVGRDGRDLALTRVFLTTRQNVSLVQQLDGIANRVEMFADEFTAMRPSFPTGGIERLRRMADCVTEAVHDLTLILEQYVRGLCNRETGLDVTDEVATIRELEGDCDSVRNDLIAAAFASEGLDNPMACRELVVQLDGVIDTIEDITDQLCYVAAEQTWIELEPYPESTL